MTENWLANKKTAKKLNRKPQVADIIKMSPSEDKHYLVLAHRHIDMGDSQFYLLELDSGYERWYDFNIWMRRWRLVA